MKKFRPILIFISFLVIVFVIMYYFPVQSEVTEMTILEKRAKMGHAVDEYLYGRMLILGDFPKEKKQEGLAFLEKAATKEYKPAIIFLAQIYEKGIGGIHRDYIKAFKWYKKGAQLGIKTAQLKLSPFEELKKDKNSFILFGIPIKKARRFSVRYILQKNGAVPIDLNDDSFCDIFSSNNFLPGTDKMQVCYGLDGYFVLLEYRYPPRRTKYGEILAKNMSKLIKKYGNPKTISKVNVVDYYLWEKDGVNIYLWMEPKTNTCFLRYVVMNRYLELVNYLMSKKREKEVPKVEFY